MQIDLEKLCTATEEIARVAGLYLLDQRLQFKASAIEHKGLNDLVSYVDKTTEEMLVKELSLLTPEATFLTEEQTIEFHQNDWYWIIDPLDGTTNFMHGLPIFSISIALMYQQEIRMGVVYEPNAGECFSAIKGKGAKLNGQVIQCSANKTLGKSLVATGFPYTQFDYQQKYLDVLKELMQSTHGLRRLGSAALDLAYTACGRFDAFFEYNLNPWDVAAGILLVQEAGGTCKEFSGGNDVVFGRSVVAGNNALSAELLSVIQKHF
jgi:myo-inositol-1(or 4)-monophosphatase